MAYTDDINEKVANILLEQGAKAGTATLETGAKVAQTAAVAAHMAAEAAYKKLSKDAELEKLNALKGETSLGQMMQYIEKLGLKSFTIRVADSDTKDYEELLKKQGILFAKMNDKQDNTRMYVFLDRDRKDVEHVSELLYARRGQITEVRPDMYINNLAPENVRLVDGLDAVEMELFRHYARQEGLLFTALNNGDGKTTVVFDSKDEPKARTVFLHTGWDLTGYNGARNREQIQFRIQGRTALRQTVENAQKEMYIVSKERPQNFVRITENDLQVYKAGQQVSSLSRSKPDFMTKLMAEAEAIDGAVVLPADQFRPDLSKAELSQMPTIDLRTPEYGFEEEQINKQNELINLVAMKMGHDNEHNATWGLWDPSVSYSEFASYEYITDLDAAEARKDEFEHFKQAAYYSQNNYQVQDIKLDTRSIDYIIAKAAQKRKGQERGANEQRRQNERESVSPEPEK